MDLVSSRTFATADAHQSSARQVVLTLFVVFLHDSRVDHGIAGVP